MSGLLKDDPNLKPLIEHAERKLRNSAKLLVTTVLTQLLTDGDILILSMMGIDGRSKILDVFMEECAKLKEEFADDHHDGQGTDP